MFERMLVLWAFWVVFVWLGRASWLKKLDRGVERAGLKKRIAAAIICFEASLGDTVLYSLKDTSYCGGDTPNVTTGFQPLASMILLPTDTMTFLGEYLAVSSLPLRDGYIFVHFKQHESLRPRGIPHEIVQ